MASLDLLFANGQSLKDLGWRPVELDGWWDGIGYERALVRIAGAPINVLGPPEVQAKAWPLRLLFVGDREDRQDALDALHRATTGLVEWSIAGTERVALGVVEKAPAQEWDTQKRWAIGDLYQTLNVVFPDPCKLSPGYTLELGTDPVEVPVGTMGARGRVEIYGPGSGIELLARRFGGEALAPAMALEDLGSNEFYKVFLDYTLRIELWDNSTGPAELIEDAAGARTSGWWPELNYEDGPTLEIAGSAEAVFFGQEAWK